MLTFFTTAKPFEGHNAIIQRNALQSWKLLHPEIEVIVFGDEPGVAAVSAELGLRHESHVERHTSGMKFVNYIFARAQAIARHEFLCYSNCDIILLSDFRIAFEKVVAWRKRFLLVAQRWDTSVTAPIDFSAPDWERKVHDAGLTMGRLQIPDYVDFFAFPKGLYTSIPPMVVGRSYWDHWLVWKALAERASVIDASAFIVAVHQNHDYSYHPGGKQGTHLDSLAVRNKELAGNGEHLRAILDSTHRLTRSGKILPSPFRRILESYFLLSCRQKLVEVTFPLRKRLGLRRGMVNNLRKPDSN